MLKAESDVVNIDKYLPFKTFKEIEDFCSNDDGMLNNRRSSLQKRIFSVGNTKNMKTFLVTVCDALFTNGILSVYKWPLKK